MKFKNPYKFFIPAILASIAGTTFSQEVSNFDILGVKIGMTETEILATVKKIENTNLLEKVKYQAQQGLPESIASVLFCYGDSIEENKIEIFKNAVKVHRGCQTKVLRVLFTRGSAKAFSIERTENYAKAIAPSVDTLTTAINSKYGMPTTPSSPGMITGSWYINDNGDTKANFTCSLMLSDIGKPAYRQYPKTCGIYFNYNIGTQLENPKLAARFILTSFDFRLVNADYAAIQDLMNKNDKTQQENELRSSKPIKM